jgi:hypothetical protein
MTFSFHSDGPSAANELDEQHYECNHQQNVDIPPNSVKTYQPYQPEHQKNYKNRPEHKLCSPMVWYGALDGIRVAAKLQAVARRTQK